METIKIELEISTDAAAHFIEELHERMDRDGSIDTINDVLDTIEEKILTVMELI